jgi:hypothetical protein
MKRSNIIIDRSLIHDWPEKWISLVIPGKPWTKKNGQMIRRMKGGQCPACHQPTGRPFISPSYDYEKKYQAPAIQHVKAWMQINRQKIIDDFVHVVFRFWMPTYGEVDLSNLYEGPQDVFTRARLWTDDTLVKDHSQSKVLSIWAWIHLVQKKVEKVNG